MPKEEYNAVFFDMTWRDRVTKEHMEMLGARTAPDISLYHSTETSCVFGGPELKQDYLTEYTSNMGDRPPKQHNANDVQLDNDTFIPTGSFHTTMGDTFGYGDKYKRDTNLFTHTHKLGRE